MIGIIAARTDVSTSAIKSVHCAKSFGFRRTKSQRSFSRVVGKIVGSRTMDRLNSECVSAIVHEISRSHEIERYLALESTARS